MASVEELVGATRCDAARGAGDLLAVAPGVVVAGVGALVGL